jgi:hypothetical protein
MPTLFLNAKVVKCAVKKNTPTSRSGQKHTRDKILVNATSPQCPYGAARGMYTVLRYRRQVVLQQFGKPLRGLDQD